MLNSDLHDLVAMTLGHGGHVGLADRHPLPSLVHVIEGIGDLSAAVVRHEGLEA